MLKNIHFHRYFILHNSMTMARNLVAFLCIIGNKVNLRNLFKPLLERLEHLRSPYATRSDFSPANLEMCGFLKSLQYSLPFLRVMSLLLMPFGFSQAVASPAPFQHHCFHSNSREGDCLQNLYTCI